MKVIASKDITYQNKEGKFVVMWKKGEEVKGAEVGDKDLAEKFLIGTPDQVYVDDGKSPKKAASDSKKPTRAGKKK